MKLNHLLTLSLAAALIVSCTQQESVSQPSTSPLAQSSPSSTESVGTVNQDVIKSGTFVSGEHSTQGTVQIVIKNGKPVLELNEAFKTSEMGPDLVVILHRSSDVIGSTKPPAYPIQQSDYVIIAPLQKFSGAQSYSIPDNVNLADYQSVAIWCRKFNATFGAAALN
ncbi:MAG TPA: electron transfer protein with DM13 domain protein [Cyanobacteria bacterium UBA11162]|nr:electron transfer protein with DM13 domain protein [Cyanobacteria bacterium UBA11162]